MVAEYRYQVRLLHHEMVRTPLVRYSLILLRQTSHLLVLAQLGPNHII